LHEKGVFENMGDKICCLLIFCGVIAPSYEQRRAPPTSVTEHRRQLLKIRRLAKFLLIK
jgi:hypothetical protein